MQMEALKLETVPVEISRHFLDAGGMTVRDQTGCRVVAAACSLHAL